MAESAAVVYHTTYTTIVFPTPTHRWEGVEQPASRLDRLTHVSREDSSDIHPSTH